MEVKTKEKKDRWWIVDLLLEMGELLLYIPRLILRIVKEIN